MINFLKKRVPFSEWLNTQPLESECEHLWHPIVQVGVDPSQWKWQCSRCPAVSASAPVGLAQHISRADLEAMVDSSLRLADQVWLDDQSVKGDMWVMRACCWVYRPYEFEMTYHLMGEVPFIVLFRYRNMLSPVWCNLHETDEYRQILIDADKWRINQP